MKQYVTLSSLLLLTLVTGCLNELRDEMAECHINWNNHWAARAAYQDVGAACQGLSCPHSFKEGFTAGFVNVANGGKGCPPAVPEIPCCNHMWMDHCCESDKMEAWYDGYELGAQSARETGMASANCIITRAPHSAQSDYSTTSGSATLHDSPSPVMPNQSVPPSPDTDDGDVPVIGGPQTRR